MALYKWDVRIAGIGSFPDQIQYLTQAEYDELSENEKMNGTTYWITGETSWWKLSFKFDWSYSVDFTTTWNSWDNVIDVVSYDRYAIVVLDWDVAFNLMTWPSTSTYDYNTANTRMLKMQWRFIPAWYYWYVNPASAVSWTVYLYKLDLGNQ